MASPVESEILPFDSSADWLAGLLARGNPSFLFQQHNRRDIKTTPSEKKNISYCYYGVGFFLCLLFISFLSSPTRNYGWSSAIVFIVSRGSSSRWVTVSAAVSIRASYSTNKSRLSSGPDDTRAVYFKSIPMNRFIPNILYKHPSGGYIP